MPEAGSNESLQVQVGDDGVIVAIGDIDVAGGPLVDAAILDRESELPVVIDLTDEGAGLRERALSVPRGVLAATGLSLEEVLGLQEILGRLTGALGEAADAD